MTTTKIITIEKHWDANKNLTAIRAEVRAALAVYRPSAFVEVNRSILPTADRRAYP